MDYYMTERIVEHWEFKKSANLLSDKKIGSSYMEILSNPHNERDSEAHILIADHSLERCIHSKLTVNLES
jgi:hypothetical protein